ncbi:MAG TPA: DUF3084 domain-containing protein [Abditibacteriaceae bacterium]|jgi:hypothetical protein
MRIPTSLILISVLVILACVIAYVSDNMGKKLGKKRISLLGMRPRQTATALTMASSVGIMFVTLLVVSLFSRQVRTALLRVDRMREVNGELRDRNQLLKASAASLNAQLTRLQQSVKASQRTASVARSNAQQANQKANAARQQLGTTQAELTGAQSDLSAAQQTLQEARRGEKAARRQVTAAQALYALAQQRTEAANVRAAAANTRAVSSQTRLAKANQQLRTVNQRLRAELARLTDIRLNLTEVRGRLNRARGMYVNATRQYFSSYQQVIEYQGEQRRLKTVVDDLREREKEQQSVVNSLLAQRRELEQLVTVASRVLQGDVAVPAGQLFAADTLPPGISTEQATSSLRSLLARGNEVVVKQGWRALHLAPLRIERGNEGVELNEDEILTNLATYLSSFDTPVSVRLSAARDHAPGETEILGRMLVVPVRRAFARNETIVTANMSGAEGDARLFNQFLKMVSQGEQLARQRGVVPLLTQDDPNFFASGTNERIFEALRQVQSHNGSVGVRLVAGDDLTTVEPLRVRFEVDAS